eukprot:1800804-Prorocentrum_lima.AAC.1
MQDFFQARCKEEGAGFMFSVSVPADPDSPERLAIAGLPDLLVCPVTRVPFFCLQRSGCRPAHLLPALRVHSHRPGWNWRIMQASRTW